MGGWGLLVFAAEGPITLPQPDGNSFPTRPGTVDLLTAAGFRVEETADADLSDSPPEWSELADAVDAEIERRHGTDPRWRAAQEQAGRIGDLLSAGQVRPWLVVAAAV